MSAKIHPTAIISNDAKIGTNVEIGPYVIIHSDTEIGDGTIINAASYIYEGTRIGKNCKIGPQAVVGIEPQDLSYAGEKTNTYIGDNTTIREFATIHRGTNKGIKKTVVGNNCLIMAYAHIAHDCIIGNHVILANVTQLGGHVEIDDFAILGGVTKVHQFCRIGIHTMIGNDARVVKDIPPYTLVSGKSPVRIDGVNRVGLKRRDFSSETIKAIDDFYRTILFSGLNTTDGLKKYKDSIDEQKIIKEVRICIDYINNSTRGIYR